MAQHNRPVAAAPVRRWQDRGNLILAIWLFISPWVLNFAAAAGPMPGGGGPGPLAGMMVENASWNAWVCGVVIFVLALIATSQAALWPTWLTLVLGIWLFIAPWVLGFAAARGPAWDHWVVGVLVFLASLWGIAEARRPAVVDYAHAGDKPTDRP